MEIATKEQVCTLSKTQIGIIFVFSCLGSIVVQITRLFPSGFYLNFIETEQLNSSFGAIGISVMLVTTAVTPFLPVSPVKLSLPVKCALLYSLNMVFVAMMCTVDSSLGWGAGGWAALVWIFISRALQGFSAALIFIIVQGELVDLYLKEYKILITVISGSMHIASIMALEVGVRLYITGGWLATGLGVAAFNLLPLTLLPLVIRIQNREKRVVAPQLLELKHGSCETAGNSAAAADIIPAQEEVRASEMTKMQKVAFYMPDFITFLNNLLFCLMLYSLPARMVKYKERNLDTAVLFTNLINVFSFISALVLAVIAEEKVNVLVVMTAGNVAYYTGLLLTFGSTTTMMDLFPYQYEVGSLLVGTGDAAVINLCIMSKFVLQDKMGVAFQGNLGEWSSMVFNAVLNLSNAFGTALSGQIVSSDNEIACFILIGVFGFTATAFLTFAIVEVRRSRVNDSY